MNCHMYCRRVNTFYLQLHQWFEDSGFYFWICFFYFTFLPHVNHPETSIRCSFFMFPTTKKTNPLYCSGPTACKTTAKNWTMTTCRSPQCAVSLRVTSRPSRGEGTWASWAASPLETVLPHLKILGRCGIVDRTTTKQTLWLNKMRYCHSDLNPDAKEFIPWTSMPWIMPRSLFHFDLHSQNLLFTGWISLPKAKVRGHHICHGCVWVSEVGSRLQRRRGNNFSKHIGHISTPMLLGKPSLNWNLLNNPSGGT